MDKKTKQRRHKSLTEDELGELGGSGEVKPDQVAPRGASFDTEEGRAAQGMRADIGTGGGDTVEREGAVGASDGTSSADNGAGNAETGMAPRGEPATKGDEEEDREKLVPEAKSRAKRKD